VVGSGAALAQGTLSGTVSFAGVANPIPAATTWSSAAGVDFAFVDIAAADGLFAGLAGASAPHTDFTFLPALSASPVDSLWTAGGYAFALESVTQLVKTPNSLILSGSGRLSGPGITGAVPAEWAFTGQQIGGAFSFSSSLAVVDAPTGNTPAGSAIVVEPDVVLPGGTPGGMTLTFDVVGEAGNTEVRTSASGAAPFALMEERLRFAGFFQPVDNLPGVNSVKAGAAVPVKFSLAGDRGPGILAPGSPRSVQRQCDTAVALANIETTVTAGGSSLTYDAAAEQYVYIWKTDPAWAGSCRELQVTLADGEVYSAMFSFRR
jgi:hypothetical protein